jgi:hypothetical protein
LSSLSDTSTTAVLAWRFSLAFSMTMRSKAWTNLYGHLSGCQRQFRLEAERVFTPDLQHGQLPRYIPSSEWAFQQLEGLQ